MKGCIFWRNKLKAITLAETNIHCDTCHHEFAGVPQEWLNQACPECGAENIINDKDMELWQEAHKAMDFINNLLGDVDPEKAVFSGEIRLNTAPLRSNE
jgi:predicted RNA-binding Zn-ribbon protein involved in translation (DUF1610 family)